MSDQETRLRITVDHSQAAAAFDTLEGKQEEIAKSVQGVGAGYEALMAIAKSAGAALGAAFSIGAAKDLLEYGSTLDDVASGFNRLSEAAGDTGDVLLQKLRKATGDTIPDIELMREATQALRAGIKPDEMVVMTEAARALAEETGGNAKEALDSLIFSVQSGNDRFLKTQGIIIDNKRAFEEYAKANGLVADKLDEVQKAEAIRAASLEAMKQKIADVGPITADVGDKFAQLSTTVQNTYGQFALAAASNKDINAALDSLIGLLKSIDFQPLISGLGSVINLFAETARVTTDATNTIINFVSNGLRATGQAIGNGLASASNAIGSFSADVEVFGKNLRGVNELLRSDTKEAAQAAVIAYTELAKEALKNANVAGNLGSSILYTGDQVKAAAAKFGISTDELKKLGQAAVSVAANEKGAGTATNNLATAHNKLTQSVKNSTADIKKYGEEQKKTTKETKTYEDVINDLFGTLDKQKKALNALSSFGGFSEFEKQINDITRAFNNNEISGDEAIQSIRDLSTSFKQAGADAETFQTIATKAIDGISSGMGKAKNDIDQQVKDINKSIGSELIGNLSNILADGLLNGFDRGSAEQAGQAIGSALGAGIGAAIGSYLGSPGAGAVIGSSLGGVLGQLSIKLFGGKDSAGTKFRKDVDKFFADAFDADRLLVIINGQLKQIKDLDFSGSQFGDPTSGFFDAFNKLPATAQAAFSGVATAYAEALGQGQEFAAGLAAVFVNNIGGSLNNLQLLVQASGMSFEQLHKSVVNAFLDGKLSAIEALSALQQINNISQKGIPDGIGMVVQAFENLKAAGAKGGRAATDALTDLADEAKELHLKTLPELMQKLVASGKYSAQEIKILFDALAHNGITSIEQLSKATDEQLIAILAELEAQKFPFAQGTQDAKELLQQVEKLPEKIKTKLVFDVETNMDDTTRQAAAAGVFTKAQVQFREIGQREGIR